MFDNAFDFAKAIFALLFICAGVYVFNAIIQATRKARLIETKGTETTAVISKIADENRPDESGPMTIYVKFFDDNGEEREIPAGIYRVHNHYLGEEVTIRYIQDDWELVRIMGDEDAK